MRHRPFLSFWCGGGGTATGPVGAAKRPAGAGGREKRVREGRGKRRRAALLQARGGDALREVPLQDDEDGQDREYDEE
ncbi:hypothetical protein GCM10010306_066110 [Streptomyces umbrinus]|nr:hypothetical protein GCM10010306_066110 [Streptomyces umbrinus]